MIAAAEKEASLFACPGSQLYDLYTAAGKRASAKTHQIKRVVIPAFSIFVECGHLQHPGAGWEGSPCLRYRA